MNDKSDKNTMNTAAEILQKHEDANEMHLHHVDRKWVIEAMEEYAKEKSEKPINLEGNKTAVEWFANQLGITTGTMLEQAIAMEKEQIVDSFEYGHNEGCSYMYGGYSKSITAEKYFNQTYNKNKQ